MNIMRFISDKASRENWRAVTSVLGLSAVGNGASVIQPMLVGGMIDNLHLSPSQAGYVVATEMATFALCSLLLSTYIHRIDRRLLAYIAVSVFVIANGLSIHATDMVTMCALRAMAGAAESMSMAAYWTTVAAMARPATIFAFVQATAIAYSGTFLLISPWILENFGLPGAFMFLMASGMCAALVIPWVPRWKSDASPSSRNIKFVPTRDLFKQSAAVLTLLCFMMMYIGHGAIWPYQERLGVAHGFSKEQIGNALGYSMLIWGVLGSVVALVQGTRFKNTVPLLFSFALSIVAAAMLAYGTTYLAYFIASALVAFSWFYGLPYLKGIMASLDTEGRILVAAGVVFPVGSAIGPILAATAVEKVDVTGVAWLGAFCYVICLTLIVRPARMADASQAAISKESP
jgi:predicted MFS family arabinose efflux permease